MVMISRSALEDMIAHAREEVPFEACGYLAGTEEQVVANLRLKNVDASPEHFSLDPAEQFDAMKRARELGLKLIGIYHSHPESPARPSDEDLRLANDPGLSYVIISLAGESPETKSYRIQKGKAELEKVEII